jgi:hypothetical protein
MALRRVVEQVRPRLLLHGHYHHRNSETFLLDDGETEVWVEGLGRDGMMQKAWVLLDLPDLTVAPTKNPPVGAR